MRMYAVDGEDPQIELAASKALEIIGHAILFGRSPAEHENGEFLARHPIRAQTFLDGVNDLEPYDAEQVAGRVLYAVISVVSAVIGRSLFDLLYIDLASQSYNQQISASRVLQILSEACNNGSDEDEATNVFRVLYVALQGLRLGEIQQIVQPARRKARQRQPYQLAKVTWSACVIRDLIVASTNNAAQADGHFLSRYGSLWDTTRKRRDFSRELLGPREATKIEKRYQRFFTDLPEAERIDRLLAELDRLKSRHMQCRRRP